MKQGHHYYVYILECSDGSYYTGMTNNINRRLWEHETGFNTKCYTFNRRPLILKYCIHFTEVKSAILWEKQSRAGQEKRKRLCLRKIGKRSKDCPRHTRTSTVVRSKKSNLRVTKNGWRLSPFEGLRMTDGDLWLSPFDYSILTLDSVLERWTLPRNDVRLRLSKPVLEVEIAIYLLDKITTRFL